MKQLITLIALLCAGQLALAQVEQVKDIYPGAEHSHPENLFDYNDILYFAAETEDSGTELWISDGTEAGTRMLVDINQGEAGSFPSDFIVYDSLIYFAAETADEGRELWVTDGTEAGTELYMDINPDMASSSPTDFVVYQEYLWFTATTEEEGAEMWRTDGTLQNTELFMDIYPGNNSGDPSGKYVAQNSGYLYFSASTENEGTELWRSNGTAGGTNLIKDIEEGAESSNPAEFTEGDGIIYFKATTDALGTELYNSDGTEGGTNVIKDLYPGSTGSQPRDLTAIGLPLLTGQVIFYIGQQDTVGERLYAYVPSADSIFEYINLNQGASMQPDNLGDLSGLVLNFTGFITAPNQMGGRDTLGRQLIAIDVFGLLDTVDAGTVKLMSLINEDNAVFDEITFDFLDFYMYYTVKTDRFGTELYRTPIFGDFTLFERLSDINDRAGDSEIEEVTAVGKNIFFEGTDGMTGHELYKFQAELGEVELFTLPNFIPVFDGDTIDLGIVREELDTILRFEFGRATTPSVRVEKVDVEGPGYFGTPIHPVTFSRLGMQRRDTFLINYVAMEPGEVEVGVVNLISDYAVNDTLTFFIKAEVEMDVAAQTPFAPEWKLAPNPLLDQAQLTGPPLQQKGQVQIINTQGQVMQTMSLSKYETQRDIILEDLPSGQYFVHLQAEDGNTRLIPFIKG